jgi:hypothetical protein
MTAQLLTVKLTMRRAEHPGWGVGLQGWSLPCPVGACRAPRAYFLLASSLLRSIILAAGIVSLTGCDPVRTISHNVTLAVSDGQGQPAGGVKVSMKESWESWRTWGGGVSKEDEAHCRQVWGGDSVPWREGVTDARGNAVLTLRITAIDRTRGNTPPASRDTVSSREYIIKLQGQAGQEEVRLVMKPGASVKGKSYTVAVVAIQKPRY